MFHQSYEELNLKTKLSNFIKKFFKTFKAIIDDTIAISVREENGMLFKYAGAHDLKADEKLWLLTDVINH